MAVQVAFEKAIEEAKLLLATSRGDVPPGSRRADRGSGAQSRTANRRYDHLAEPSFTAVGSASGPGEVRTPNNFANGLFSLRYCLWQLQLLESLARWLLWTLVDGSTWFGGALKLLRLLLSLFSR